MCLQLGPSFGNGRMRCHGITWLTDCPVDDKTILYQRYVDDTFVLFRLRSHANLFLNYLNSKHSNINFASDYETDNFLSFLRTINS